MRYAKPSLIRERLNEATAVCVVNMQSRLRVLANSVVVAEEWNRAGGNFLRVEIELGLTFSDIALKTQDSERRKRTKRLARAAYDNVLRLKERVTLTNNDVQFLARNLLRLKSDLVRLGESL